MDRKEFKIKLKEFKGGNIKAAYDIGLFLYEKKKYKKALIYFEEYLKIKDYYHYSEVKRKIGDCYYNGLGVKKDLEKAINIYNDISYTDKELKKIVIKYYYDKKDYSKIIHTVAQYVNVNDDALRFCYEYYSSKSYYSTVANYAEMMVERFNDEEIMKELIEYYFSETGYIINIEKAYALCSKYPKVPLLAYKLAKMYYYGIIVKQDYEAAYKYFDFARKKEYLRHITTLVNFIIKE